MGRFWQAAKKPKGDVEMGGDGEVAGDGGGDSISKKKKETTFSMGLEMSVPCMISGFGMILLGCMLDDLQNSKVLKTLPGVNILIFCLLQLKGNLELTMSSRLTTQANLGEMETFKDIRNLGLANIFLVQCQSIVVGLVASAVALFFGKESSDDLYVRVDHAMTLSASSIFTASAASFVLCLVIIGVIVFCRKLKLNPDNVVTPIICCTGDILTVCMFTFTSTFFMEQSVNYKWLSLSVIGIYLASLPLWIFLTRKYELTKKVLKSGWWPILLSMLISGGGGKILDIFITEYKALAVFEPVINGVGGSLISIQACRMTSSLYLKSQIGTLSSLNGKPGASWKRIGVSPYKVLFGNDADAKSARAILALVMPGQAFFAWIIRLYKPDFQVSNNFLLAYPIACFLQVTILLYFTRVFIRILWILKIDPDSSAIPMLIAIGELIGTALLVLTFWTLVLVGDKL